MIISFRQKIAMWLGVTALACGNLAAERPNVVLFVVDDMGVMDTSVPFLTDEKGNPKKHALNSFYRTPSMEQMAEKGVRFSTFYANSVCSPSRVSLLNGQSSARHRVTQWINPKGRNAGPEGWRWDGINPRDLTLANVLKDAGYTTIFCGKAHYGVHGGEGEFPSALGFEVNIAGCSIGQPGSYYGEKNYGKGLYAVPHLDQYHGTNTFLTEALTLEVNKAMTAAKQKKKPFFVQMSHYALHAPFHSDPRFAANYKDSGKSAHAQAFATLVEGMDKSLGDMVRHLEKIGEADNTLIVLVGDNGSDAPLGKKYEIASSAPLRGKKGTHYEGGTCVPFMVSWAKVNPQSEVQKLFPIKPGIVHDDFAAITDIFPTILKVAGVKSPAGHIVDGKELTDYFDDHEGEREQAFFMHFPHPHNSGFYTSYREGDWKMIYHYRKAAGKQVELFNLKNDPSESVNLAASEKMRVADMLESMKHSLKQKQALYPVDKAGKTLKPTL